MKGVFIFVAVCLGLADLILSIVYLAKAGATPRGQDLAGPGVVGCPLNPEASMCCGKDDDASYGEDGHLSPWYYDTAAYYTEERPNYGPKEARLARCAPGCIFSLLARSFAKCNLPARAHTKCTCVCAHPGI